MLRTRRTLACLLLFATLLTACAAPATPAAAPTAALAPTAVPAAVGQAEPTAKVVLVTATPEPAATVLATVAAAPAGTGARTPTARLSKKELDGDCRLRIYMYLSGFAPDNPITVDAYWENEIECGTAKELPAGHWQRMYPDRTDATGRLMVNYHYEATGSYRYVFRDEQGNQATLAFVTTPADLPPTSAGPAATATQRPSASKPAPTKAAAAPVPPEERVAVVKSATLNLRSGPGQNYPVVGKATQGEKLYPVARVGNCEWLQVGARGGAELVWIAGGAQFVTLNVPCTDLMIQESLPDTPTPAPYRPPTGLLSRSGAGGGGVLRIKNGTDTDGVVILVTLGGKPAQAAYIRLGDTFEMSNIADGTYRLYFTKGEGWDKQAKEFTSGVTRQRFSDTLNFSGGNGWEVTLYGVAGGNAGTQNVAPGDFPGLP